MGSEPRMRGRRQLRPAAKKPKRPRDQNPLFAYRDTDKQEPTVIVRNLLNAIDHLGNQRFVLPPFSEHFQRWTNDLESLIDEFQTRIPEANDAQFQDHAQTIIAELRDTFSNRSRTEQTTSSTQNSLHQQSSQLETDLSKFDRAQRSKMNELRYKHEISNRKLNEEIEMLDRKRIRIINRKQTMIEKIMQRPKRNLEIISTELETKKIKLEKDHQTYEQLVQDSRNQYTKERQKLESEIILLRKEIDSNTETEDDALEIRKEACLRIHDAIDLAMKALQTEKQ